MINTNCVQCGKRMRTSWHFTDTNFPYCIDPSCPNYGLIQSPDLPEETKQDTFDWLYLWYEELPERPKGGKVWTVTPEELKDLLKNHAKH